MGRSLGSCVRCAKQHPATTVQRISYGESSYELALCEKQADNLLRDLIGWSRCGTLVEDGDAATFTPSEQPARRIRGGILVASHMHVPDSVIEPVEDELPALPTPRRPRFDETLPFNADRWVWTDHAIHRARLRDVSSDEVLWCAEHPDVVRPGDGGLVMHIRGPIKVVLDPTTHRIITVADRRYADDDERDLRNAS